MKNVFGIIFANYTGKGFGELLSKRTVASLPFGGRYRLVDFSLSNMVNSGITTVGLIMPSAYRSLIDHVGSGREWDLDRKIGGLFILPGTVYGGHNTSEEIMLSDILENKRYIQRRGHEKYALIVSASKVYNMDYRPMIEEHIASGRTVTFAYYKTAEDNDMPLNCMVINRDALMEITEQFSSFPHLDLVDLLHQEIPAPEIGFYNFDGYVKSIDSLHDYIQASMDLLDQKVHFELFRGPRTIFTKIQDEAPTLYGEDSSVVNSMVSAGCEIEGTVENCILFRNVKVAKGAHLRNCIIMQHAHIEEGAVLDNVVMDKYCTVKPKVMLIGTEKDPLVIGKNVDI